MRLQSRYKHGTRTKRDTKKTKKRLSHLKNASHVYRRFQTQLVRADTTYLLVILASRLRRHRQALRESNACSATHVAKEMTRSRKVQQGQQRSNARSQSSSSTAPKQSSSSANPKSQPRRYEGPDVPPRDRHVLCDCRDTLAQQKRVTFQICVSVELSLFAIRVKSNSSATADRNGSVAFVRAKRGSKSSKSTMSSSKSRTMSFVSGFTEGQFMKLWDPAYQMNDTYYPIAWFGQFAACTQVLLVCTWDFEANDLWIIIVIRRKYMHVFCLAFFSNTSFKSSST